MQYDLIVIGGGPAGYVGAIRGAQLGKKVAIIEADRAGGTCLNWGCIPTKALLKNAELYSTLKNKAKTFGLSFDNLQYDWGSVVNRSRQVSDKLASGIEFLFKKNKIDAINGFASLLDENKVEVRAKDGSTQVLEAHHIVIATGAKSRELPPLPFNGRSVISSKDAMVLSEQPKEMIVIGAGAIGVEFAYIYNAFGTKVTLIEMQDTLLPVEDQEIGAALQQSFSKQGVRCLTKTRCIEFKDNGDSVTVVFEGPQGRDSVTAQTCLVAIGVTPILPGGIQPTLDERGFIAVGDRYETSIPHVYAVGDIAGPPWLAHVASFEATQCVEGLFIDGHTPRKVKNFPGCTYAHPQVASVGKTEAALKEEGIDYKVGKFPFMAIGKAQASADPEGFVKLLFGKEHGELLGAHIIGDNATELISEMGLALESELTDDEIHATIHAHPTLSEAIHEATLDADGHAIHF